MQHEKQEKKVSGEDRGDLVSEKWIDDSWKGDGAGDCMDIEVEDCAAVKSAAERGIEIPDFCLPFAKVAVRSAFAGGRKDVKRPMQIVFGSQFSAEKLQRHFRGVGTVQGWWREARMTL